MTKRCHCQKTGILYDHLMVLNHVKESNDQLIILNRDDIIQILLDIRENLLSRSLYSSTISNRIYMRKSHNLPLLQRSLHTCCTSRLNTDYFDMWIQKLRKCGNTCCKSASTDRNQNIINKWKLLNDLHCNGTLSCGNCRIIERMDKGISLFLSKFQCMCTCLIIYITMQDNLCTITLCSLNLDQRSCGRHNNHCLHTIFMRSIGNTLCMISGGCCDQTFISLFIGKSADLIIGTTNLICTCTLHILRF